MVDKETLRRLDYLIKIREATEKELEELIMKISKERIQNKNASL